MKKFLLKSSQTVADLLYTLITRPLENTLLHMLRPNQPRPKLLLRKMLQFLNNVTWLFVARFRIQAIQWRGENWSVLLIQDATSQSQEELKSYLFPQEPVAIEQGWAFIWHIPRLVARHVRQGDLVVCETNQLLNPGQKYQHHLTVPLWLRASIRVVDNTDQVMERISKTRQQQIKKLADRGFSYSFSYDPADFEMFYYDMYVPHVTRRHQERAIVEPIETKYAVFEQGGLIIVKHNRQPVAAGLRHIIGDTLIAASYAIHKECQVKGVSVALHWYTIEWAQQNQLSWVDFGMTRPRLNDGVFEYKRQWGAHFEKNILDHSHWSLVGDQLPAPLLAHLNQLGLIAITGNQLRGVLFRASQETEIDPELRIRMEQKLTRADLGPILLSPAPPTLARTDDG
jgi:hypothetical protein